MRESPAVRLGQPHNPEKYSLKEIQGIKVYTPYDLPDIPLTIALSRFLWFKKLVIEGWQLT
ncbi:CC/Se motif family (seleno)protein [Sporomusa sphaeroides]|uniref:CC/Se motif family (seleno)protein n=1 Tax=Sporomusa sphaeroides TaxID=47679 RepID=UPI003CC82337